MVTKNWIQFVYATPTWSRSHFTPTKFLWGRLILCRRCFFELLVGGPIRFVLSTVWHCIPHHVIASPISWNGRGSMVVSGPLPSLSWAEPSFLRVQLYSNGWGTSTGRTLASSVKRRGEVLSNANPARTSFSKRGQIMEPISYILQEQLYFFSPEIKIIRVKGKSPKVEFCPTTESSSGLA